MADKPEPRRTFRRVLVSASVLFGLLLLAYIHYRLTLDSVWSSIEMERATGLSAVVPGPAPLISAEALIGIASPGITRAATLNLETRDFDHARAALNRIIREHVGYLQDARFRSRTGFGRSFNATVRMPADQFDTAMAEMKSLGRVLQITEAGEQTQEEAASLNQQIENAKAHLVRLQQITSQRRGAVGELVGAEKEVSDVRSRLTELTARKRKLESRVDCAALQVTLAEEYRAALQLDLSRSWLRLRNSLLEGVQAIIMSLTAALGALLHYGLPIALWGGFAYLTYRLVRRHMRRALTHA